MHVVRICTQRTHNTITLTHTDTHTLTWEHAIVYPNAEHTLNALCIQYFRVCCGMQATCLLDTPNAFVHTDQFREYCSMQARCLNKALKPETHVVSSTGRILQKSQSHAFSR